MKTKIVTWEKEGIMPSYIFLIATKRIVIKKNDRRKTWQEENK